MLSAAAESQTTTAFRNHSHMHRPKRANHDVHAQTRTIATAQAPVHCACGHGGRPAARRLSIRSSTTRPLSHVIANLGIRSARVSGARPVLSASWPVVANFKALTAAVRYLSSTTSQVDAYTYIWRFDHSTVPVEKDIVACGPFLYVCECQRRCVILSSAFW